MTEDLLKLANISIVCAGKDATRAECEVDPYEVWHEPRCILINQVKGCHSPLQHT